MKTLILFRHAKSDWSADYGVDHERPLNARGERAAARMGKYLAAVDEVPPLILTSTAVRARTTVELAAEAGGWTAEIRRAREFYGATPGSVIAVLREQADAVESILIAGHEPTWSELLGELVSGGEFRFPTAAMARVTLEVDRWMEVTSGCGVLAWHVTPKLLGRAGIADESQD